MGTASTVLWASPHMLSSPLPTMLQYDPQFGDAFWNSSKYGMVTYLLRMMSSWAIVCSVWYLPPMTREVGAPATLTLSLTCVGRLCTWEAYLTSCVCYRKMKMPSSLPTG